MSSTGVKDFEEQFRIYFNLENKKFAKLRYKGTPGLDDILFKKMQCYYNTNPDQYIHILRSEAHYKQLDATKRLNASKMKNSQEL